MVFRNMTAMIDTLQYVSGSLNYYLLMPKRLFSTVSVLLAILVNLGAIEASWGQAQAKPGHSIARTWNEQLLSAIRIDSARPTVHARNLFHTAVVMWDSWAAFEPEARQVIHQERAAIPDTPAARHETISYAAYRLLQWRFKLSPNAAQTDTALRRKMAELGYDVEVTTTEGDTPAALGNRVARSVIAHGLADGANEEAGYANRYYEPVNPRMDPHGTGNPEIVDPDRWQQLHLPNFVGQSGQLEPNYPPFVGPEWGDVKPYSLSDADATVYQRGGRDWRVYFDPGPPPRIGGDDASRRLFKAGFEQVVEWSGLLDASRGDMIDISPASIGNNTLGTNDGNGYDVNPVTGQPYEPQVVPAGDYYRVLAEFWADGPSSETPPGHWFTMLNIVSDQPSLALRIGGQGPELDRLSWDLHTYLALGGAMHDAAIAAWSIKGWYDSARPISAVRFLCDQGQSSDPGLASYHPDGINLNPGVIELITPDTAASGGRHHHLAGENGANLGEIAIRAWRGPDFVPDPKQDVAGVGWMLCGDWWPYQRPNFVTPPFAGYVSGHSTYSRAAAETLTLLTGSKFFPGGLGIFRIPANDYLVFERGPSRPMQLQWATYQDAADECSLSRIYGGIHPTGDDIPGRKMGYRIGHQAFAKSLEYFPPGT